MNPGDGMKVALLIIGIESMVRAMPEMDGFLEQLDATDLEMEREGKTVQEYGTYRKVVAAIQDLQKAVRTHDAAKKKTPQPEVKIEV